MKVSDFKFADGTTPDLAHIAAAIKAVDKSFDTDMLKGRDANAALMTYATGNINTGFNPEQEIKLTSEQLNKLGAMLVKLEDNYDNEMNHPTKGAPAVQKPLYELTGTDGVKHNLRAKELATYLTSSQTNDGQREPVNEWARRNKYNFTQDAVQKTLKLSGGIEQPLAVETPDGSPRVVTSKTTGGQLTYPISGDYTRVADVGGAGAHAALNAYVAPSAHEAMESGRQYEGKIFVMQQMKVDKNTGKKIADEPKVIFANSVDEARDTLASTWQKRTDFVKANEGTYIKLTPEQYKQFKVEFQKDHDHLNVEDFSKRTGAKIVEPVRKREFDGYNTEDIQNYQNKLNAYNKLSEVNGKPRVDALEVNGKMDAKTLAASKAFKAQEWVDGKITVSYLKQLATTDADKKAVEAFSKGYDSPEGAKLFHDRPPQAALEWAQQKLISTGGVRQGDTLETAVKRDKVTNWTNGTYTQSADRALDGAIAKLQQKTVGQQGVQENNVINVDRLAARSRELAGGMIDPSRMQAVQTSWAAAQNGGNGTQNINRGETGGLVANTPANVPVPGTEVIRA